LYFAICSDNIEAVKLVLGSGLQSYCDESRGTPIHTAASHKNAPILLLLFDELVFGDVSALDEEGYTALQVAIRSNIRGYHLPVTTETCTTASLTALVDRGAAIDQLSRFGEPALYIAAKAGNLEAVLFLLDRGASATFADRGGTTALHHAAHSSAEMATALLAHGAQVNAANRQGKTPLHYCAACYVVGGAVPAAMVLLEAGANVNATDNDGNIPLHNWAQRHFRPEVEFAQLLIDYGADVVAHNNANQRPSDTFVDIARTFLLAAEEAQKNNHRYKRPRLEDLQPRAVVAARAEAAAAEEEEDESEDDSDDEEEDED
jgi:ankyrin repeat protein